MIGSAVYHNDNADDYEDDPEKGQLHTAAFPSLPCQFGELLVRGFQSAVKLFPVCVLLTIELFTFFLQFSLTGGRFSPVLLLRQMLMSGVLSR